MELHPDFRKLIDLAVEDSARKNIHGPWFNWRSIFQGVVAALIAAVLLNSLFPNVSAEPESPSSLVPPPMSRPQAGFLPHQ